jgi:uncharacterized protein (TIGR03086 family)
MTAADEHREIAGAFTARVRGAAPDAWDNQSPVPAWTARDVVRHLVDWFPSFLADGSDVELPSVHPVDDDPVASWEQRAADVQAVLDDPERSASAFHHPRLPPSPLGEAISRYYTADVFMHTWDLARATGQDERLDPERCRRLYEGMLPLDDMLRQSGQYGPKVAAPDDADVQTKLLAFIGRTP